LVILIICTVGGVGSDLPSEGSSSSSSWMVVSAHMKSGSLRFEFEVEVNRNILLLIQLTELIIVSVLKTLKNLEGTCHLLFC